VRRLFEDPFVTRWVFDVEILARLQRAHAAGAVPAPSDSIVELPLQRWRDVRGGKIGPADALEAILDLFRVSRRYLSRRA